MKTGEQIYNDYCIFRGISSQDSIIHKNAISQTFDYQRYCLVMTTEYCFQELLKDLDKLMRILAVKP